MAIKSQTQRTLLLSFIGSIVCCGMAGIYCLLQGRIGWFEERVMMTTLAVGAASIVGMASAVTWERRRWHPIGLMGMIATSVALVLVLVLIWTSLRGFPERLLSKTTFISCVSAVTLSHVGLLSLARLNRKYEWVRIITIVTVATLAAQIILMILAELDDEIWFRAMGILAIIDVCGTLSVPILHRVSGIQTRESIRTLTALSVSLTCPRCVKTHRLPVGRSKCPDCKLKFSIEVEEEHCPTCGYALYLLQSTVCPECGTPITQSSSSE